MKKNRKEIGDIDDIGDVAYVLRIVDNGRRVEVEFSRALDALNMPASDAKALGHCLVSAAVAADRYKKRLKMIKAEAKRKWRNGVSA